VGGEFYRGLLRGDFYRGLFKAFRRWGQVNSETGPIRLVSWTPYISSSGASLEGGRGELYRGLGGTLLQGLIQSMQTGGKVNSETGPLDMSLGPHISVLQGLT
jgi:hypothetical protein